MLSNTVQALSWSWEELGTICYEMEPPHCMYMQSGHRVWMDCVVQITNKVIPMAKDMMEQRVPQGLFEAAWGPYSNAQFLVPKKNGKYRFSITPMRANCHTLEDARILPNVENFSESFAGLPIPGFIDFHCGYNQKIFHKDTHDYTAFHSISWPDWNTVQLIQYQHLPEYLRKYYTVTWDRSRKYLPTMWEWTAERVNKEQRQWKGCLEFKDLL